MSTQRQAVVKPNPVPGQSRAEAARPPKPAIVRDQERTGEVERGRIGSRFDEIKKRWFDTVAELKKVTWPDRETTKNLTLVVIGISTVLGALLGGLDWVMQQLFALI